MTAHGMLAWELDGDEGAVAGAEFAGENRDDLDAIDAFVQDTIRKVEDARSRKKFDERKYEEWRRLRDDWQTFYHKVIASWYVSDEDIAYARKKRDDINRLLTPEAFAWVQAHAKQKKIAATPEEYKAIMEEGTTHLERNWGKYAVLGVAAFGLAYLLGHSAIMGLVKRGAVKAALH